MRGIDKVQVKKNPKRAAVKKTSKLIIEKENREAGVGVGITKFKGIGILRKIQYMWENEIMFSTYEQNVHIPLNKKDTLHCVSTQKQI